MLLAQILGGLTGIGIAYTCYWFDERKHEQIQKQLREKHRAELAKIRQEKERELRIQKERIRNNK